MSDEGLNSWGRPLAAMVAAGVWVNFSEFLRNELMLKSYWVEHYRQLGMTFPSTPLNGVVWMAWGFLFAGAVFAVSRKFPPVQAVLLIWLMGFVLMWLVIGNLHVLPAGLLYFAVPLSLLETAVAVLVVNRIAPGDARGR